MGAFPLGHGREEKRKVGKEERFVRRGGGLCWRGSRWLWQREGRR